MGISVFLYRILIFFYGKVILLASLWSPKARLFIQGRKNIFNRIKKRIEQERRKVIWMHCASLGEFEQGRPIMENLRGQHPDYALFLTFFSPSGYEVRKDFEGADYIFYLPLDSPSNAKHFLNVVRPELALFVKYEFWYDYLRALHHRNIPTILFSAYFQNSQPFFRSYGGLFRKMLTFYQQIFVQDESSRQLLNNIEITEVAVAGDTRFDRSLKVLEHPRDYWNLSVFKGQERLLVAGSTWPKGEYFLKEILPFLVQHHWKLLIVPHEVDNTHIQNILKLFNGRACLWDADETTLKELPAAIVQTVGHLSHLYRYADAAWIGGGFEKGIHNIIEPAVFGIPVFFGPNYGRFREAKEMIEFKGALSFNHVEALVELLSQTQQLRLMGKNARDYVVQYSGATLKIMSYLNEKYFSTSS